MPIYQYICPECKTEFEKKEEFIILLQRIAPGVPERPGGFSPRSDSFSREAVSIALTITKAGHRFRFIPRQNGCGL